MKGNEELRSAVKYQYLEAPASPFYQEKEKKKSTKKRGSQQKGEPGTHCLANVTDRASSGSASPAKCCAEVFKQQNSPLNSLCLLYFGRNIYRCLIRPFCTAKQVQDLLRILKYHNWTFRSRDSHLLD